MADQVRFIKSKTAAEATGSSKTSNAIYFTSDTHKIILNGEVYGEANAAAISVVNNGPTLSWGNTSTIGTVGGTALTVKMPANPDKNNIPTTQLSATDTNTNKSYCLTFVNNSSTDNTEVLTKSTIYVNAYTNTLYASKFNGDLIGNANSATKLETARNLAVALGTEDENGVSFDGSANVLNIPVIGQLQQANHYKPESDTNSQLNATASGGDTTTSGATTQVVTGVTLSRDPKGHITGLAVKSIGIKDTDDHYTATLITTNGSSYTTQTNSLSNGNVRLNLVEHDKANSSISIKGTGATTVTTDANGVITINSTDTKVTSAANHYTPTGGTEIGKTTTTQSTFGEIILVGLTKDSKGHITANNTAKLPTAYLNIEDESSNTYSLQLIENGSVTSSTDLTITGGTVLNSINIKADSGSSIKIQGDSTTQTITILGPVWE